MHRGSLERQHSTRERVEGALSVIAVLFLFVVLPVLVAELLHYRHIGERSEAEVQREKQETVARLRQDVEQLKQQVEALSADLHPPSADLQPADRHTRDKWDRIHDLATDIQEMAYPETSQAEEDEEESRPSY